MFQHSKFQHYNILSADWGRDGLCDIITTHIHPNLSYNHEYRSHRKSIRVCVSSVVGVVQEEWCVCDLKRKYGKKTTTLCLKKATAKSSCGKKNVS